MMWWRSLVAVAVGGMLGCLLRWVLAMFLNRYFPSIPPGTLAANLIGCYIIGMALAFFTQYPAFAPEWRLFVTTGFCGGLTTFSTFSAEVVLLMRRMTVPLSKISSKLGISPDAGTPCQLGQAVGLDQHDRCETALCGKCRQHGGEVSGIGDHREVRRLGGPERR